MPGARTRSRVLRAAAARRDCWRLDPIVRRRQRRLVARQRPLPTSTDAIAHRPGADRSLAAQEPGAPGQVAAPELARSSGGSEYFRTNSGGFLSKIKRHLPGTTVRPQPQRRLAHT